jgi:hypothetical protein
MFVVGEILQTGMMWSVIIAKDVLITFDVRVRVAQDFRVACLGVNSLINCQARPVPEKDACPKQTTVLIECLRKRRLFKKANRTVLLNTTSQALEVVEDIHWSLRGRLLGLSWHALEQLMQSRPHDEVSLIAHLAAQEASVEL